MYLVNFTADGDTKQTCVSEEEAESVVRGRYPDAAILTRQNNDELDAPRYFYASAADEQSGTEVAGFIVNEAAAEQANALSDLHGGADWTDDATWYDFTEWVHDGLDAGLSMHETLSIVRQYYQGGRRVGCKWSQSDFDRAVKLCESAEADAFASDMVELGGLLDEKLKGTKPETPGDR